MLPWRILNFFEVDLTDNKKRDLSKMDVSDTSSLLEPLVHADRDESIRLELSEEKNGSCPLGHSNRDVIIHSNPNCIAITHKDGHLHQVCDAHNEVRPTSSDDNPSHCFLCYAAPPDTANDEVRSIIHVQAICCAAEIPAIRSILDKINGVENVAVVTTTKLVYVTHDPHKVAANDLIAALNEQMFEATLRQDGAHDKGESRIKPNITSKYVESTFMISSLIDTRDMDNIKRLLSREYLKDDLAQVDAHVPSKTVKIIHDPHKLSATTLQEFIRKSGCDVEILADGLAEGIWSSAYENGIKELHAKLEWNIFLSGVFWGVSMLHLIDSEGKWKYMQYFALLSVVLVPKIALKAIMALRRWQFDTNCMMMFAIVGALALQEFSEAAAVSFFYSISDWLESISTSRARNALSHIANLRPDIAQVRDPVSGKFIFVPASEVPVGSIVTVRTGDKIPCDGIIVKGMSVVDESSLSGESRPVHKISGNEVSGGTINSGLSQLSIKTTSTADDSAVARLVHLVEDAQSNTSPTEQLIDKFAPKYTLVMVLAAISMCTFPWIAGTDVGRKWTHIGLVTIVIACPCAIVISTPVTYVAGIAAAAQQGILVKGGAFLEALSRVKRVVFDKTGTLTEGNFKLLHFRTWNTLSREESLQYIYAMEVLANHPLAAAMISAAKAECITIPGDWKVENHQNLEGEGLNAVINGKAVYVGNSRLFDRLEMTKNVPDEELSFVEEWLNCGSNVGFVSVEGFGIVCSYCISDSVRGEAKEVVSSLDKLGIDVNMLTGDNANAADVVGTSLGLKHDHIKSNLLPHEKVNLVRDMVQTEKDLRASRPCCKGATPGLILMIGDGVNDAPALALADVGVAMGAGAALAMKSADITLLDSNLGKILKVLKLGKSVRQTIVENLALSLFAKAVVIGLVIAGHPSLWAAIISDVGAMLIVTLNGMKLLPSKKSLNSTSCSNNIKE